MGRTIVIGDIHGCFDELMDLIKTVGLTSQDRVVAVGDLTVKGPKSLEVVEMFRKDVRFSSVIGNHDLALVRRWNGEQISLKPSQQTAFAQLSSSTSSMEYLSALPTTIDLESHLVVHAGLRPGVALEKQSIEDLTELRTLGADRTSRNGVPWYEAYRAPKTVLFGHWPASEPRRGQCAIGLDTGCVYGYLLTGYVIETDEFISVNARQAYAKPSSSGADSANAEH